MCKNSDDMMSNEQKKICTQLQKWLNSVDFHENTCSYGRIEEQLGLEMFKFIKAVPETVFDIIKAPIKIKSS